MLVNTSRRGGESPEEMVSEGGALWNHGRCFHYVLIHELAFP